jgi:hypothetical protein
MDEKTNFAGKRDRMVECDATAPAPCREPINAYQSVEPTALKVIRAS